MTDGARDVQRRIGQELGVSADFDPAHEADRRSQFLADLLAASGLRTLVVGISGGVDSATVGMHVPWSRGSMPYIEGLPGGIRYARADGSGVKELAAKLSAKKDEL